MLHRLSTLLRRPRAVTLLEILVVLVIVSLLATLGVGMYTKEVVRARYARARAEIAELEIAINRYYIDVGQYPPSGSSDNQIGQSIGTGWLQLVLRASANGNLNNPASPRWQGPYIQWDYNWLGSSNGTPLTETTPDRAAINFLDPFKFPYYYIRSSDYSTLGGTRLPATHPFATTESFYNPTTFQILSFGNNRATLPIPNRGLEQDDVNNFAGSLF